jgi:hypothetical protein
MQRARQTCHLAPPRRLAYNGDMRRKYITAACVGALLALALLSAYSCFHAWSIAYGVAEMSLGADFENGASEQRERKFGEIGTDLIVITFEQDWLEHCLNWTIAGGGLGVCTVLLLEAVRNRLAPVSHKSQ